MHPIPKESKLSLSDLKKVNPFVEGNIFKSVENVNLKTIVAYKDDEGKHLFLEHYDDWSCRNTRFLNKKHINDMFIR